MRRNFLAASLVAVVLLGACGSTDPGLTARRSNAVVDLTLPATQDTMAPPSSEPPPPNPNNATIDFGTNKEPQAYDDYLQLALADVQDYWRVTYPETYGAPFVELSGGIWASYPGREGKPIPTYPEGCRGDPQEIYIAEQNAFYCSFGDYIAYDDFHTVPDLVKSFGQPAVGIVFAHEFGHAIQTRVANPAITDAATVYGEQQADCFAGSWTAHVARGESPTLTFSDDDIRSGLSAMVSLKDPLIIGDENGAPTSIDVFEGGAHGTAFDRVGAFEHGFDGGAAACKDMEINPLPLLNVKFDQSSLDLVRRGNTPYDGDTTTDPVTSPLQTLLVDDLTRFWTASVASFVPPEVVSYQHDGPYPECSDVDKKEFSFGVFYCPSTNQLLYDDGFTRALFRDYGDFSVGYVISNAWSEAVQTELGSSLQGEKRNLINDCLTGAWTKDIVPDGSDTQPFAISPGDLDEAVETALILGTEGINANMMGSAFEKISYFRAGVLDGVAECNRRITSG